MSRATVRVLVTRPVDQAGEVAARLRDAHLEPVVVPTVAVEPVPDLGALDGALREPGAYGWVVLSSVNGARVFVSRLEAMRAGTEHLEGTALVTGAAGARVMEAAGLRVTRVVSPFSAAGVLEALASERLAGARVLLPRAEGGREELAAGLRALGAVVDEVIVYRTVPVRESDELVAALWCGVGAVTFFSPSAVRGFVAAVRSGGMSVERALGGVVVACLGATTAGEARAHGLSVDVVAGDTTAAALVEGLGKALAMKREVVWSA